VAQRTKTVRFAVSDTGYDIDLNHHNASAFRHRFAPYMEHARKAARAQHRGPVRTAASRQRSENIRAWAKARASRSTTVGTSCQRR
jgi:Lsr2